MTKLAVIDCGTNTFNLIVVELYDGKKYKKIFSTRSAVKLGEGAINSGFIAPEPFQRGIAAIGEFKKLCDSYGVKKILAFATSAIRDASNGKEFVNNVFTFFGIQISIIDGNREAELIYYGVKDAVPFGGEISLIMDIGGGSNEFILANNKEIVWKQSFNIGAARLSERFKHSNPITERERHEIETYLTEQLNPLWDASLKTTPVELVGSSGAFDSLVEMIHGELGGEPLTQQKTAYELDMNAYRCISERIKISTLEERRNIKGLLPIRFDMIVISCIMIDHVLAHLKLKKMRVSTFSLKEGALTDYLHQATK